MRDYRIATIAVRMDAANEGARDYYLLPAIDMTVKSRRGGKTAAFTFDALSLYHIWTIFLGMARAHQLDYRGLHEG